MADDRERLVAIAYALEQSHKSGRARFVYRPRVLVPPYVIADDEDAARSLCDEGGYVRCDASVPPDDPNFLRQFRHEARRGGFNGG